MSNTLLNAIYVICGLILIYIAVKTVLEKDHASKIPTFIFWISLAIVMGFGQWIPEVVSGVLVVLMCLMAMLKRVTAGKVAQTPAEYTEKMADKIGYNIFIPAFGIGVITILIAIFTKLGALVGLGIGAVVSCIIVLLMTRDKPVSALTEGRKLLEAVGPLSMLPMLLAALGAVFAATGVGEVIAKGVSMVIPQGNIIAGIAVYAVGMALFTMIMGNAFAAFSVITIGIGIPFVLNFGLNPNVIGIIALTSGYCGTLMTPMAANFNIVPVAILEMKDRYGVIKRQIPVALVMLAVQIVIMYITGR